MTFNDLQLIPEILKALKEEGYTTPTPIQEQAIPIVARGTDLLGCAQTGTGKTAAFAIPILQLMHERHDERRHRYIKVLVLTPTRELAIQIDESFKAYGRHLPLRSTVIFGGVSQVPQVDALRKGTDILIATPGRLLDLMQQGHVSLRDIGIFVLDEADRMLDMGFIHDVKRVVAQLPQQRQTLFFSATMPPEIQKLANTILHNPEKVEVTPVSSTAETVTQSVYMVEKADKRHLLEWVLKDPKIDRVLVFTRTKHGADRVAKGLKRANISAEAIHGDKSQNARQRALSSFKDGEIRVLVATDIAARGIDVEELAYVINFDIPEVPETYVHRIGRSGRAGASGTAFSFCMTEERPYWAAVEKLIKQKIPVIADHPYKDTVHTIAPQPAAKTQSPNRGHGGQNNRHHGGNHQKRGQNGDSKNHH